MSKSITFLISLFSVSFSICQDIQRQVYLEQETPQGWILIELKEQTLTLENNVEFLRLDSHFFIENNQQRLNSVLEYKYNQNDSVSSYVGETYDNGTLTQRLRNSFKYNLDLSRDSIIIEEDLNSVWDTVGGFFYTYSNDTMFEVNHSYINGTWDTINVNVSIFQQDLLVAKYFLADMIGVLDTIISYEYIYDQGDLVKVLQRNKIAGQWSNSSKIDHRYSNGRKDFIVERMWFNNQWQIMSRTDFRYQQNSAIPDTVYNTFYSFFDSTLVDQKTRQYSVTDSMVGIENPPRSTLEEYTVFPNPSSGTLFLSSMNNDLRIDDLSVYDNSGAFIEQVKVSSEGEISLGHLPAGLYFLKNKKGKATKIILSR